MLIEEKIKQMNKDYRKAKLDLIENCSYNIINGNTRNRSYVNSNIIEELKNSFWRFKNE